MLVSPYQTTACRHHPFEKLQSAVKRANIVKPLSPVKTPSGRQLTATGIILQHEDYDDIPGITQCLPLGDPAKDMWVLDGRPFFRRDGRQDSYRLVSHNDFSFQCTRLALSQLAAVKGSSIAYRLTDVPAITFVRWISMALVQRFSLDMASQIRVSVITAYYYYLQLDFAELNGNLVNHQHAPGLAQRVSRATSVDVDTVLDIADDIKNLATAEDWINVLRNNSGTVRLSDINFVGLIAILSSSWQGYQARENVAVALQHLPTFWAMVFVSLNDRSYRRTVIAKRLETAGRASDRAQCQQAFTRLVEQRYQ